MPKIGLLFFLYHLRKVEAVFLYVTRERIKGKTLSRKLRNRILFSQLMSQLIVATFWKVSFY